MSRRLQALFVIKEADAQDREKIKQYHEYDYNNKDSFAIYVGSILTAPLLFVMTARSRLVGYVTCRRRFINVDGRAGAVFEIEYFEIVRGRRNKGHGRALLDYALHWMKENRSVLSESMVVCNALRTAWGFWEKMGFRRLQPDGRHVLSL